MDDTQDVKDRLLTVDEVARILAVHPKSVRRMLAEGRLEGVHPRPGSVRVRLSDVSRVIAGEK